MHDGAADARDLASQTCDQIRARDRRYVWHPWSPLSVDRSELTLSHAKGWLVWDIAGKEYIDGASLNATTGYGHPHVHDAVSRQMRRLQGVDLSTATHEPVGQLAERLASYLPARLCKTVFVNSGSEGIEAALHIATSHYRHLGEKRSRVVTFARGYHGSTVLARSLTRLPGICHYLDSPLPVSAVDLPTPPHALRSARSLSLLVDAFERAIEDGAPPAAVLVEPLLNVGGGVVLPDGFLHALRKVCDSHGVLLILDEVFTAYGRSGRMFAFERENAEPDILVSSKGLSGGSIPIAAVAVQQSIYDSFDRDPYIGGLRYGHTTSGHAVGCAAALATLDVLEKEDLIPRAQQLGHALLRRFESLLAFAHVRDVRGLGLILVIEMANSDTAFRVAQRAKESGLLLRQHGENIMVVPPLTIDDAAITALGDRLQAAVTAAFE